MVMDDIKSQICCKVTKPSQALSPVKLQKIKSTGSLAQAESGGEGEGESPPGGEGVWSIARQEESSGIHPTTSFKELRISQSHSKKVIKHALRQQAKRRRKNTTIAAGNSAPLPRILVPPQCELEEVTGSNRACYRPPTMMEVLSSIPGFSIKQRKRTNKKLSTAAQLEQTKEGCIDLETPDSILVNTNLRSLLNKHTFNQLPPLYQYKLVQLLPHVDRSTPAGDSFRLSASGLNNEFFARACLEWRERLAEGEFTPENQQKLKAEAEREKSKLDPWKLKHFEPIWGESVSMTQVEWTPPPVAPPKPARPAAKVKTPPTPPPPRLRTVGAVTRAVANYREKREAEENSFLLEPNKKVKSSNKPDTNIETSMTVMATSTITSQSIMEENIKPSDENLKLADEEMKDEVDKKKSDWTDEAVFEERVKSLSVEETEINCARQTIPVWENVEVVRVDPVQDYVNPGVQMEKQCDESRDSEAITSLCDISASEGTVQSKNVVNEEETSTEEDDKKVQEESCDTEIAQDQRLFLENDQQIDSVEKEPVQSNISENSSAENDSGPKENIEDQSLLNQKFDPDNVSVRNKSCENNVNCHEDTSTSEVCDRLRGTTAEEVEAMEVTLEEIKDVTEVSRNIDSLESHENISSPHLYDSEMPLSQESTLNFSSFRNSSDAIKTGFVNERRVVTEEDIVEEEKLPDCISEDHLNDGRYDVDINDSLEFVNEETSLQTSTDAQNNQEMSNNQDSVDSNNDMRDDSSGYNVKLEDEQDKEDSNSFNVKLEDELDIQDTGSNIQSQDSQDTRADEDSNCVQDNSSDLILPDSEEWRYVQVVGGSVEDATNASGVYSMYNSSTLLYPEALKEEVEAVALFAAAWGAVDSSTEKLLAEVALQEVHEDGEVNVIPMQEELEVRLEEIKAVPNWSQSDYDKSSAPQEQVKSLSPPQYPGHVKLELEDDPRNIDARVELLAEVVSVLLPVTLTPEVDSQVSSTVEGGGSVGGTGGCAVSREDAVQNVIPPTTIVCLPSATPAPIPQTAAQPGVVSSSAVPYLALTTSTPVRALPTKPKASSGSSTARSSRNVNSKPPPGAVNLERSYQICQAVIQNSPNRDQLRCQLKPPPSLLMTKTDKTQYSVVTSSRGAKTLGTKQRSFPQRPTTPVLVKHVFTSSQGIPVTMAVLPHAQSPNNPEIAESQMGHYVLVQRTGAQVRRSNSAPPSNNENVVGVGARGRPASVGEGGGSDSPTPGYRSSCPCSLKAMIACKKCGAFCHDDCIDPSRVCVTCLIR